MSVVERHISPLFRVCHSLVLTLSLSLVHEPSPFSTVQFEAQIVQNCDETVANLNGHIDSGLLKATLKTTEGRGNVCYNIRLNV